MIKVGLNMMSLDNRLFLRRLKPLLLNLDFEQPWKRRLLKTLWVKEKMVITSKAHKGINLNIDSNILLHTHVDVQKLEGDFVYGYMQAMDSEKDPRNLVLAFACAFLVVQNFSLGVFVEEFFEVVSCYFPIDFTPVCMNLNL